MPKRDRDDSRWWNKVYRETLTSSKLEKFKEARRKSVATWKKKNHEKVLAYSRLNRAIKKGEVKRRSCEWCPSKDTTRANFIDYKNMVYVFLCPECSIKFNRVRIDRKEVA